MDRIYTFFSSSIQSGERSALLPIQDITIVFSDSPALLDFKGLINAKVDLEAQGRDTTFTKECWTIRTDYGNILYGEEGATLTWLNWTLKKCVNPIHLSQVLLKLLFIAKCVDMFSNYIH